MKIASITVIYKCDIFIKPCFDRLMNLDRNIVIYSDVPNPSYAKEHGNDQLQDDTIALIRKTYPKVEFYKANCPNNLGLMWNQGLDILGSEYDYAVLFDPDMHFTKEDYDKMIDFVRDNSYESYTINFQNNSINYYMDFTHGLRDSGEPDMDYIISTNKRFNDNLQIFGHKYTFNEVTMHHFRGWNKPKSVHKDWESTKYAQQAFNAHSDNGKWFECPQEIRDQFDVKLVKESN